MKVLFVFVMPYSIVTELLRNCNAGDADFHQEKIHQKKETSSSKKVANRRSH